MLNLNDPFDACVWAACTSAFFSLMRFGEVCISSRNVFSPSLHLTCGHTVFGSDLDGKPFARLDLPTAKTAKPGEIQHIYLVEQGDLCPIAALYNLARVVPASASDPLFSWQDSLGDIRPVTRSSALAQINNILLAWGWGNTFGHSFCIGGASFFLAEGVSPEIIRITGRWRSLASGPIFVPLNRLHPDI
jgi:hypothetical protein